MAVSRRVVGGSVTFPQMLGLTEGKKNCSAWFVWFVTHGHTAKYVVKHSRWTQGMYIQQIPCLSGHILPPVLYLHMHFVDFQHIKACTRYQREVQCMHGHMYRLEEALRVLHGHAPRTHHTTQVNTPNNTIILHCYFMQDYLHFILPLLPSSKLLLTPSLLTTSPDIPTQGLPSLFG